MRDRARRPMMRAEGTGEMAQALDIWMNGVLVGAWTTTRTGTPAFRYERAWLASAASRALSLSLPITSTLEIRGEVVNHYFDNQIGRAHV